MSRLRSRVEEHFVGAVSPEQAQSSETGRRVGDFVRAVGGHSVITKVLICNNGIAAVKEIRSVRKWAYDRFGDERAIQFTVMATPDDLRINADYIRMADKYVEVPGGPNANNYANVELIVDIAERAGVHAVWAGWGHASENPRLPEMLARLEPRILFLGPPGTAMRALGDKISSTIVAQHANVPCLPWSGTGITETIQSTEGYVSVPDDAYERACVHSAEEGLVIAQRIGFPVMIKASEGGGGKGIRKCVSPDMFVQLYQAAVGEVPGSPVFVMKLASAARHLEVQVLADQYGQAISLFGRDCSVQRRHQKIIEEAPVSIAPAETRLRMEQAAVRLAKLVGYVSAGTVEWLYSPETDTFAFLELNPRLQVEHPTTEMVTGVNIPAAQLQIAMGIPLQHIDDVRELYGLGRVDERGQRCGAPSARTSIDFDARHQSVDTSPKPRGHVIACRITAENPDTGFKPGIGSLSELNFRSSPSTWGYFSVSTSGALHEYADSQFGHVFSYGADREEARKNMVFALKELSIRSDFHTTTEYLVMLLEQDVFVQNQATTAWLDGLIENSVTARRPPTELAVLCGAAVKAHALAKESRDEFKRILHRGQVPPRNTVRTKFSVEFIYDNVKYQFVAKQSAPTSWTLHLQQQQQQQQVHVSLRDLSDGGLLIGLAGASHTVYWFDEVGQTRLVIDGQTCRMEEERDPTQICSPSPGKLVRLLVENGEHVVAGQTIAEIEVMKMYLPLVAQEDGVVSFVKVPGVTLSPGDLLGILSVDDVSKINRARPFTGTFAEYGDPEMQSIKPAQQCASALRILQHVLDGYDQSDRMYRALDTLVSSLRKPSLPFAEAVDVLSSLTGRVPAATEAALRTCMLAAEAQGAPFPAKAMRAHVDACVADVTDSAAHLALTTAAAPLYGVLDAYALGLWHHEMDVLCTLLERYMMVESQFQHGGPEAVLHLRAASEGNLDRVVELQVSHDGVQHKNALVLALLVQYVQCSDMASKDERARRMVTVLHKLSQLQGSAAAPVALKAREILLSAQMPSFAERRAQMEQVLRRSVTHDGSDTGARAGTRAGAEDGADDGRPPKPDVQTPSLSVLCELSDLPHNVSDVLHTFFGHEELAIAYAALVTYVMRVYRAYDIVAINFAKEKDARGQVRALITWHFQMSADVLSNRAKEKERQASTTDLADHMHRRTRPKLRIGALTSCAALTELPATLAASLKYFGTAANNPVNVLSIAIPHYVEGMEADVLAVMNRLLAEQSDALHTAGMRRISLLLCQAGAYPRFVTYRRLDGGEWVEQRAIRNVEPALSYQLELDRIEPHFEITPLPMTSSSVHLYHAQGLENRADVRFFVRALIRPGRPPSDLGMYLYSETERVLSDVLNTLEVALGRPEFASANGSHIFMSWLYPLDATLDSVIDTCRHFEAKYADWFQRLRIDEAEVRVVLQAQDAPPRPVRVFITSVTAYTVTFSAYDEVIDVNGAAVLKSIARFSGDAALHRKSAHRPYANRGPLQLRRVRAERLGTTFVYDLPDALRHALRSLHVAHAHALAIATNKPAADLALVPSDPVLQAIELVPQSQGDGIDDVSGSVSGARSSSSSSSSAHVRLVQTVRPPAHNTLGMVAWRMRIQTPEFPDGRPLLLLANDVTIHAGSFGPAEDAFFAQVCRLASTEGIPLLYVSANSGARLGLAPELIHLFRAKFVDDDPTHGFEYLYLDDATFRTLRPGVVQCTPRTAPDGQLHHVITDVVGDARGGLGVECLSGSGLIAGEMSRARHATFTTTIVTGRTVGIGAYLARLGGRVIQVQTSPMILTGYQALNKLLGREVYTSNLQLGGPSIMYSNGVSHLTVPDDLQAMHAYLQWLSYVPERRGLPLRITPPLHAHDTPDRDVVFTPTPTPYDPRALIEGAVVDGTFQPGLFDRGSFQETLAGWATSVVVGRARLGGIPFGVIAVETRTLERVIPADPANPHSNEQRVFEAGQVWYPNSAYKTAQAIVDFDREGLPLLMLANWRGFSGGQQDMYDEILKQGSKIVDGLAQYHQPVFVHIPPAGELRGGSWVVLDAQVNARGMIEMSADSDSARGGVLEASGLVEIKFRAELQRATKMRLDPTFAHLTHAVNAAAPSDKPALMQRLQEREKHIAPFFHAMAVEYADAHDRAGRMLATGVLKCAMPWAATRRYFYWRCRRRLIEARYQHALADAIPFLQPRECLARIEAAASYVSTDADEFAVRQLESHLSHLDAAVEHARADAMLEALSALSPGARERILSILQQT